MHVISIPEAKLAIKHVAIDLHEPIMFWGAPGVGKSAAVAQAAAQSWPVPAWLKRRAKTLRGRLCDIRLSQYDSVDLRGFPGVNAETGLTIWHAPSTLPFVGNEAFQDDELIFLFLDEINAASPAVSAVAYQLLHDRRVGEHKLRDNVVIIAAGNREGDKGVTNRQPLPLANRMTHFEVGVDVDAWCEWGVEAGVVPPIGVAFIQWRKPLLLTFDPSKTDKTFATPRTWEKALRYYNSAMPEKLKMAAMAGAVGDGVAAEFWGFVDIWAKVTPVAKIIADPEGVALPEEISMCYATAVAVSGAMTAETITPLHTFVKRLDPEFAVMAWTMAVKRDGALFKTTEFIDFTKRYKAVFK